MTQLLRRTLMLALVMFLTLSAVFASPREASATFNGNNLIDDSVFTNSGSLNAGQIDSFLNGNPSSCISSNPNSNGNGGFRTPDPQGWSPTQNKYLYGGNVTAGQAIYDTATIYNISPKVILSTLQKEQSLVTGGHGCHYNTPDPATAVSSPCGNAKTPCTEACPFSFGGGCVNIAVGYGCPDYCNAAVEGFSPQITLGSWILRFGQQRAYGILSGYQGYESGDEYFCYYGPMTAGTRQRSAGSQACGASQIPGNTPISYDGSYTTIDGSSVTITNGSTATLYNFTPFTSGNKSFVTIFEQWFGSTTTNTPLAWQYEGQQAFSDQARTQQLSSIPTVAPGGSIYVRLKARNIGNLSWAQNVVAGTSSPHDRKSVFAESSWLSAVRPTYLKEASVVPGQVGTFDFILHAPSQTGTYKEYFNLLVENSTWFNDPGQYFEINVVSPVAATNQTNTGLSSGAIMQAGDNLLSPDIQSVLTYQPDGNLVLYGDSAPIWNSTTSGKSTGKLYMQSDGNLVLYDGANNAVWASSTSGNPGAHLVLQTDGNVVIYPVTGPALWNTGTIHNPDHLSYVNTSMVSGNRIFPGQSITTADRKYSAVLQKDGNLVIYSTSRAIWSSGTWGKTPSQLIMQSDGNLVLYSKSGAPLWYTGTNGHGQSRLIMQSDGNLVLYRADGRATWASNTSGRQ